MSQKDCACPQLESLCVSKAVTRQGEGVFFLANPDVVCTPDGRGQGQLHHITWTELLKERGGSKLDRNMSTIANAF